MDPIRIGVVGTRGRGAMAPAWNITGRSVVVAGMDVSEPALEEFKKSVGAETRTTTNFDEFMDFDDIDAVAIMCPEAFHEEYAVRALEAGRHVFCEKPMAITVEGCDRMIHAWRKSGKHLMIGFNMRYMNIFRVMKDIVDSGTIGEIKAVWVRHFVGKGGGWYFHDWHANSANSTSLLLQKGCHDIDMIHWITGRYTKRVVGMGGLDYYGGDRDNDLRCPECPDKDDCVEYHHKPARPFNPMDQCVFREEVDVEDTSMVLMELEGGIKASYQQCHFTPDYCRNYTFIGTEGRMENLDDKSEVIVRLRDRSNRWANLAHRRYDVKPAQGGHGGADPLLCKDLVDRIREDREPAVSPLAGRMSVAVGCAGSYSIRNGNVPVDIPAAP